MKNNAAGEFRMDTFITKQIKSRISSIKYSFEKRPGFLAFQSFAGFMSGIASGINTFDFQQFSE